MKLEGCIDSLSIPASDIFPVGSPRILEDRTPSAVSKPIRDVPDYVVVLCPSINILRVSRTTAAVISMCVLPR